MLVGRVTRRMQALVELHVAGTAGKTERIGAAIDTGFNGFLTLPGRVISALELPFRTVGMARLADGSLVPVRKFEARVSWFGADRDIHVLEAESVPLIGMELLTGCDLSVRVEPGGEVRVCAIRA